jgi:hypothetical protein
MKAAMKGPTSSSDRGPPRAISMMAVWGMKKIPNSKFQIPNKSQIRIFKTFGIWRLVIGAYL